MIDISKDRFKLYREFYLTSFLINVETVLIRNPICDITGIDAWHGDLFLKQIKLSM